MKRSHRRSNYLQSLSLDMNGKTKPRNGSPHKEFLPLAIKRCKSTPAAMMTNTAEFIECSLKLFPHLIHIFELTKEFIHRASGVIDIPNEWADLDVTFFKAKVIALRCPEKDCRPIEKYSLHEWTKIRRNKTDVGSKILGQQGKTICHSSP